MKGTMPDPTIRIERLNTEWTLPDRAYEALKRAIMEMRIYDGQEEPRLDERRVAVNLGISRTPVREAVLRLEHEGLLRTVPRRGVFVVRKRKSEIVEIILASAALEGIAGRLAAERASDEQIGAVRRLFEDVLLAPPRVDAEEYSTANLQFHQHIVDLARSQMLTSLVEQLKIHMRAIRAKSMSDGTRMQRSPVEHQQIVSALEARDGARLEREVRAHGINLANHVERFVNYLE